jgi:RNA polymerase sigma factor (sigma-70 family)
VSAVAQLPAEATGLLYERHHRRIFAFCLSRLGSREDAEDAVQTTFMNAQRGLRSGVVPEFELAWLFAIARNVCRNSRDSATRRGRVEAVRDLEALQDVVPMPERGGDVSLAELMQAVGAIPERQRRALLLREFQDLSYDDIAVELGISITAVETLIFRARRSVAGQLGRRERRGALAWLFAFLHSPLHSGAAALTVAAVAATVATTTIVVAPLVVGQPASAPAPVAPRIEAPRPAGGTANALPPTPPAGREGVRPVRPGAKVSRPSPSTAAQAEVTPVRPAASQAREDVASSVPRPAVQAPSPLRDPIVTLGPIAAPPAPAPVPLLPEVELPVQLPPTPAPQLPAIGDPPMLSLP